MKSSVVTKLSVGFFCIALVAGSLWAWRHSVMQKKAISSQAILSQAIQDRDFITAKSALHALPESTERTVKEQEIREAELRDAIARKDGGTLRQATAGADVAEFPAELLEQADLVLAREALWNRDYKTPESLAARWADKNAFPGRWTLLWADVLLARGEKEQARAFLEAANLSGGEDALRHARLALMNAREPWKAMESLDAGLRADPRNAEILSFRAQIQEAAGRNADARLDYVAAVLSEPASPLHRDVLANFQLRTGEPSNAADTWRDGAETTGLGIYAFKAWFWSRMCGVPLSRPLPEIKQPGWKEVVDEIRKLPDGAFTSSALDIAIGKSRGLSQRPEVLWLRVLEAIRVSNWKSAMDYIYTGFPEDAERLSPGLATRLLVNITAISGGDPRVALAARELPKLPPEPHPFLVEFHDWKNSPSAPDDRFSLWLARPVSLAGTLFAHGWHGAALDVASGVSLAPVTDAPSWFDFGYSRCLLVRDGPAAARQWLESLPTRSVAAELTHAEILLTGGSVEQGMKKLESIAATDGPHAGRAAWSLALGELDRGNTAKARKWVEGSPELLASIRGKEILVRSALAEGATDEAGRLYGELGTESVDAMIYLSKQAFASKDWVAARKWTGELARRFPAEPQFRKNLLSIDAAEAAKP